ncbi:MAG TPA: hypothetical protein PLO33_14160 [Kouleothrix sp.]|uniref:hypothetical protein n=1 Tax=Kouleothrix sp. TaxID=2779161 RepID=UPI002CF87C15|nr:hypothetical protein [Kouleothrix sp.]HRC76817.1 hypothetical protein [Kouleothrix sp.]
MAEQKTAQQFAQEQYKVVENAAGNAMRVWADLATTTTEYSFQAFEQGLRYNQELGAQAEKIAQEALANYRQFYQDGMKTWQGYMQGVNELVARLSKN